MFYRLDVINIFFLGIVFFLLFVLMNGSYLFIIGGVLLFSGIIFLCMVWNGFMFFGLIFMMVYSRGILLLFLYVSAMLGDYEVQREVKSGYLVFLIYFILCYLRVYDVLNFFSCFICYSFGRVYLAFCLLCLRFRLGTILDLLLKKNY